MAETCPYCRQPLSADPGPYDEWTCGTWRLADGELYQTSRCRVVQLEAENERLKATTPRETILSAMRRARTSQENLDTNAPEAAAPVSWYIGFQAAYAAAEAAQAGNDAK